MCLNVDDISTLLFLLLLVEMGAPRGIELGVLVREINGFQGQFNGETGMFDLGYCFELDQYRKGEGQPEHG